MGLRLKFNLVLLAVFAVGFAMSGMISWNHMMAPMAVTKAESAPTAGHGLGLTRW